MHLSESNIDDWLASLSLKNESDRQTETNEQESEKWKLLYQGITRLTKTQATHFDLIVPPR